MSAAETPGSLVTEALLPATRLRAADVTPGRDDEPPAGPRLRGRRVVVIGRDYSPAASPLAPYTTAVAEHLAGRGAAVTVLTGVPERPDGRPCAPYRVGLRCADPGWFAPEAPRVIRLRDTWGPAGHGRRAPARSLRDLVFAGAVTLAARRLPADLVVAVTPSAGGAAAAARLAARRDVPLVTLVQGVARGSAAPRGQRPRRLGVRVTAALERFALRRSDQVAVASEAYVTAAEGAEVDPERLHLMPNWTRVSPATESRTAARAALGWATERFTVVHAGPMGPSQDLVTVVESARLLGGLGAAVDVVLVGDGDGRTALEQRAFGLGNVRFLDPVDDDVLPLVLAAADVLVVSGAGTGEPGQVAAYLGAGRPVLAAVPDGGAVACELRRAGGAGVRVAPGDPAALAQALALLQGSPPRREAMSRAALRYARACLGREASLRRLDLILDAALGGFDADPRVRGC